MSKYIQADQTDMYGRDPRSAFGGAHPFVPGYGDAPVAPAPVAPAPAPANPLDKLNKALGLNIGNPYQNSATRQATDALPAQVQVAGAMGELDDQRKAAIMAQRIQEAGINLDVTQPGFEQNRKAAEAIYNQIYGQAQQGNSFLPPGNAYMGGGPAPTGSDVLAAGGKEVTGYGGTLISGRTVPGGGTMQNGATAPGTHNQFMLRQGPRVPEGLSSRPAPAVASGPSPAAMKFLQDGIDPNVQAPSETVTEVAQETVQEAPQQGQPARVSAFDEARSQYSEAKTGASARERYQAKSPMVGKGGEFVGMGVFDTVTGKMGVMDSGGKFQPMPAGARPSTATGLNKPIPDIKAFRQMKSDLTDAEVSLKNMDGYLKSVGDARQGLNLVADKFAAGIKTLVGKGLNPQEIATKMAQGQLQGLLGANRTNVVGGGVMTEADALRVIEALGGDVGALQNKEVVKQAIGRIYSSRYKQYQDDLNFYNGAVDDFYGTHGHKKAAQKDFNPELVNVFDEASADQAPAATASFTPEKANRLAELRAKLGK